MSRAASPCSAQRLSHAGDPVRVEQALGEICRELDAIGARVSPSKVKRLIDQWNDRIRFTGFSLSSWLNNQLALHAQQLQDRTSWGLRDALGNVDTTGQRAAQAADRDLDLGANWDE